MPKFFIKWLVTAAAILATPHLVSGVYIDGLGTALAVSAVLGLLNLLVRPILILITLPLTVFSLGLFLLVINAMIFKWAGSFVMGFAVDSFSAAFIASLWVSFFSWLCQLSLSKDSGKYRVHVNHVKSRNVIDLNSDGAGNWK